MVFPLPKQIIFDTINFVSENIQKIPYHSNLMNLEKIATFNKELRDKVTNYLEKKQFEDQVVILNFDSDCDQEEIKENLSVVEEMSFKKEDGDVVINNLQSCNF